MRIYYEKYFDEDLVELRWRIEVAPPLEQRSGSANEK